MAVYFLFFTNNQLVVLCAALFTTARQSYIHRHCRRAVWLWTTTIMEVLEAHIFKNLS